MVAHRLQCCVAAVVERVEVPVLAGTHHVVGLELSRLRRDEQHVLGVGVGVLTSLGFCHRSEGGQLVGALLVPDATTSDDAAEQGHDHEDHCRNLGSESDHVE